MPVTRLGVVGAGTMGGGIAEAAVRQGFPTVLYDVEERIVDAARERIRASLDRQVQRRRLAAAAAEAALARLQTATRLEDLAGCDLIIEAAPEDLALKRDLFAALDRLASPDAILASNTSSLSITALAGATARPERVVGLHFFNPAPLMPLVEVIPGRGTTPEVLAEAAALARALGKTPVQARDTPGFIVNRIARPFYLEALRLLAEGAATAPEIDRIMRLAGGFRMGPFELLDLIGLDVNLAVTESIYGAFFHEPRFRPHPLQEQMVQAGLLGRKSGRGFYNYGQGGEGTPLATERHSAGEVHSPPDPAGAAAAATAARQTWKPRRAILIGDGQLAAELVDAMRGAGWEVEARSPHATAEDVDLLVDALIAPDAKRQLWERLDRVVRRDAVRLTLALAASASELARHSRAPEAVVGFATLPPWKDRRLVEVLPGLRTDAEVTKTAAAALQALGKATAVVRDGPGGAFARIFAMIVNEAAFALAEGVAAPADIDTALRLGANYPHGPLALADAIGLDVLLAILEGLQRELGEDRYRPAPLLRTLVAAGRTGRAAGRGFHEEN